MNFSRQLTPLLGPLLCLLCLWPGDTRGREPATPNVTVREWPVPWPDSRPRDPAVDSQGRVWFCGQRGNYLAHLDPDTGQFHQVALADNTHPHNLVIDHRDQVWYAGNRNAHIGRLDPATGQITSFPLPPETAGDPHTLQLDAAGRLWFTAQWANHIGRLTPDTGALELLAIDKIRARPYGIKLDSRQRPWIALFGTHKLATLSADGKQVRQIDLPSRNERPRRLEVDAQGDVWYVDYLGGVLGRYQPDTGSFSKWPLPAGGKARPYGTALDNQQRLWIAQTGVQPNRLAIFDIRRRRFVAEAVIPSGGGSIRHMYYHPPSDSIWFGTDKNTLGRAQWTGPPPGER